MASTLNDHNKALVRALLNLNDDELLVLGLFSGWIDPNEKGRRLKRRFLEGAQEKKAMATLARLMRSNLPLHPILRAELGDLFDPNANTNERKLIFSRQRRVGSPTDKFKKHLIAYFVFDRVVNGGDSVPVAWGKAEERFGVGYESIKKIWSGHQLCKAVRQRKEALREIQRPSVGVIK